VRVTRREVVISLHPLAHFTEKPPLTCGNAEGRTMATWFEDDTFDVDEPVPLELHELSGPKQVALVEVYRDGQRTSPGWGLTDREGTPTFMPKYLAGDFWAGVQERAYWKQQRPFAFVMRSMRVICLDIDKHAGGADGFKGITELGELPPTLAETSKSGAGRHLFYELDEPWDDKEGFGHYADIIGLAPGVDMRAVGCVYHHSTQRWNNRPIAKIPDELKQKLDHRRHAKLARATAVATAGAVDADDLEVLIMHDDLLKQLNKDIPSGKRNNTLFAIGRGGQDHQQHQRVRVASLQVRRGPQPTLWSSSFFWHTVPHGDRREQGQPPVGGGEAPEGAVREEGERAGSCRVDG
jgi:hypothetical protein